jgi:hypothetical protein
MFVFETDAIMPVQGYIQDHNERAGRLASPYEWLTPM